jgi:arginase
MRDLCLIRAPFNLGLRPLRPGHEPGTWRAPQALTDAGLLDFQRFSIFPLKFETM